MTDERINYLYEKSGIDTLCISTSECNSLENVFQTNNINEWKNHEEYFSSNYIHSFFISIPALQTLSLKNGTEKKIKLNIFHHAFIILPFENDTFKICDSWEGIHFMNCREKILTSDQIVNYINGIFDGNITNEDFDYMFNNDNNDNWKDDIEKMEEMGEVSNDFSADELLKNVRKMEKYQILKKNIIIKIFDFSKLKQNVGGKKYKTKNKNKNKSKSKKIKRKIKIKKNLKKFTKKYKRKL